METAQENPNIENESSNSESGSRSKKENSVEETSIEGNDTKFMNAENESVNSENFDYENETNDTANLEVEYITPIAARKSRRESAENDVDYLEASVNKKVYTTTQGKNFESWDVLGTDYNVNVIVGIVFNQMSANEGTKKHGE